MYDLTSKQIRYLLACFLTHEDANLIISRLCCHKLAKFLLPTTICKYCIFFRKSNLEKGNQSSLLYRERRVYNVHGYSSTTYKVHKYKYLYKYAGAGAGFATQYFQKLSQSVSQEWYQVDESRALEIFSIHVVGCGTWYVVLVQALLVPLLLVRTTLSK